MSENRAIVEEIYVAFNGRDYENVVSHFTEDIEWIVAENSPFADLSPYHGINAIREGVFERITAGFESLTIEAERARPRRKPSCAITLVIIWRTSSVPNESNLCPSCRKQPLARSRSMSTAASPRFRSSDGPVAGCNQRRRVCCMNFRR